MMPDTKASWPPGARAAMVRGEKNGVEIEGVRTVRRRENRWRRVVRNERVIRIWGERTKWGLGRSRKC